MRTPNDYKVTPETDLRKEVIEMHIFDKNESEEKALCKDQAPVPYLLTVQYYIESRVDGVPVGTVYERCKALAIEFSVNVSSDLEAEGLLDWAGEYRRLADSLEKETASKRGPGWVQADSSMCAPLLRYPALLRFGPAPSAFPPIPGTVNS